jgi:tetratricopeptide (TPR) repeat protein
MKNLAIQQSLREMSLLLISASLLLTVACSPSGDEAAQTETVSTGKASTETAPPQAEAVQSVGIPITTESDPARALYAEGQYLIDVGRGVQAREKFMAAIAEDPAFALAYYGQSNAALSFAEFQHSLDSATQHSEGISDGEQMMIDINRSFLSNDSAAGLAVARELVGKYPDSARAWIVLAGMQANENDNEGARVSNKKALALEENSAAALTGLAINNLFGEPRDFVAAEKWASQFIAAYPGEAKGYEVLGDIKRAQNDLEAALEAYNSASKIDPTLEAAAHKRGHVNSFLGNIEDARAAYDEAIAIAPLESKASYAVYKGYTKIHGGDIPAAIDELEALADQVGPMGTPEDQVKGLQVFALNSAAFAALHTGLLDRAATLVARRNELQMSIAEDVGTDDARRIQEANCQFFDGLLAAYQGNSEGAVTHAKAISALVESDDNPRKLEPAHWVFGLSALQSGDFAAAVEHLRQADFANNMFVRYELALAEEGMGNSAEAKRLFTDVASYNFNSVGFALTKNDAAARAN